MSNLPRLLPLAAVAIGGVLVLKTLASFELLPDAIASARAFAEEAEAKPKPAKAAKGAKKEGAGKEGSGKESGGSKDVTPFTVATNTKTSPAGEAANAMPAMPSMRIAAAQGGSTPAPVCAPAAAELAKDAGLSPAELQVLQSLGTRRGQLDQREKDMDLQLKLLAAAEAKIDAKLKTLAGLKGEIQALLGQADQKEASELDRLVVVYQKMKPREAAAVMTQLDDKVRVPVAAKMKEAALAAILAQMPPAEAKKLTELLAHRYADLKKLAEAPPAPPPAPAAPAAKAEADPAAADPAKPVKRAAAKPRAKAKPKAVAKADPATMAPAAAAPKPAVPPTASAAPAKPAVPPTASAAPAAPQTTAAAPAAAAPAPGQPKTAG